MRIPRFRHIFLLTVLPVVFTSAAYCGRADKGGSSYGANTAPCPAGSGPQTATAFGAITVTCFGPGSGVPGPTLFELENNAASFPSTLNVLVSFSSPATTDYGLITCDFGSIPCVAAANPVNFSGAPTFNASSALFTFSNFTGELAFYVNEAATITNVTSAGGSATPEPRNTAAAGLLLLCSLALIRRFLPKWRVAAPQS
jgi:hypothetical protein